MTDHQKHLDWVAGLKPGDPLLVESSYDGFVEVRVERRTKTQVVTNWRGAERFNLNGRLVGATAWDSPKIVEATPERLEVLHRAKARARVSQLLGSTQEHLRRNGRWDRGLDHEQLQALVEELETVGRIITGKYL